jgi:hypothetical protein
MDRPCLGSRRAAASSPPTRSQKSCLTAAIPSRTTPARAILRPWWRPARTWSGRSSSIGRATGCSGSTSTRSVWTSPPSRRTATRPSNVVRRLYHFGRGVSDLARACRLMGEGAYDRLHAWSPNALGVNRRLDAEQAPSLRGRRRARDDPRPRPSPEPVAQSDARQVISVPSCTRAPQKRISITPSRMTSRSTSRGAPLEAEMVYSTGAARLPLRAANAAILPREMASMRARTWSARPKKRSLGARPSMPMWARRWL